MEDLNQTHEGTNQNEKLLPFSDVSTEEDDSNFIERTTEETESVESSTEETESIESSNASQGHDGSSLKT